MAIKSDLPITHKCAIHALVAAYMNLLSQLTDIPNLIEHVHMVSYLLALVPSCMPAQIFDTYQEPKYY